MTAKKNEKQTMCLSVTEDLTVTILPSSNHEFLMTTKEVASGYGVGLSTIREHQRKQSDELIEGKHFTRGVSFSDTLPKGYQSHQVFWTKRGIVRLGFFIKSKQAKLFRDWAEDLVIEKTEKKLTPLKQIQLEHAPIIKLVEKAAENCGSRTALAKRIGVSASVFSHLLTHPHWLSDEMLRDIEIACLNIVKADKRVDTESIEALLRIKDEKVRLTLFNKMKKGGLI